MKATPPWWDPYSCQPYTLPAAEKPRLGIANLWEYAKVAGSAVLGLPAIATRYMTLKKRVSTKTPAEFIGLSVMPNDAYEADIVEMIEELGVKQLLVRIPSWETSQLDDTLRFVEHFPDCSFVFNILQSRESVADVSVWKQQVRQIIAATKEVDACYWVGNAVNRTKWGCAHTGDYLRLQQAVEELRAEFDDLQILGSSIIDFEPLLSWRTLWNFRRFQLQGNAALLYVNRRHSPFATQYRVFDLENKLRLAKVMTQLSNRCDDQLWITETNWPLLNTKPYTPNSGHPSRTVDEATQAKYLKWYYQIAWQTGWVERVYWWQLINPGYGLVDHREGKLRKMPSFYAFQDLLAGALHEKPDQKSDNS